LVCDSRGDDLAEHKKPFSRPDCNRESIAPLDTTYFFLKKILTTRIAEMPTLLEVIEQVKPHVLMGLAGQGPSFFKEHVDEMQKHVSNPIIFPLSNPTSKAEISATDAYTWTNGKCIFAAGSPFDPVTVDGKTYYPAQGKQKIEWPFVATLTFAHKFNGNILQAIICSSSQALDLVL
jgi:hypothetical protein